MSKDITPHEALPLPTEQCRVPRPGDPSMRCVRFRAHTGDHGYAGVFWRNESSTGRASAWVRCESRHRDSRRCVREHGHSGAHNNGTAFWGGRASDITTHDSPLVDHARYELERAGFFDADSDYGGMIGESVMQIVRTYAAQGHSGASHHLALGLTALLLQFKPLTPLTDDPDEWVEVADSLWQNRRDSEAFSHDGGKTYDLLSERRRWLNWVPWRLQNRLPRGVFYPTHRSKRSAS